MAFNFETAGLAFKPSAGGKFVPQKLGDPPSGFGEHSNTALRVQIDRLCEFLSDVEYRLPRRVIWELLAAVNFASMSFGDELPSAGDFEPDPDTGVSSIPKAHLHADYSQDDQDMRVLAYIGDEWREDINLIDALLLPLTNLVATIRAGQVAFDNISDLPATLEGYGIEDAASAAALTGAVSALEDLVATASAGFADQVEALAGEVLVERGRIDDLSNVARSGAYEDLSGKPDLSVFAQSGQVGADITDAVAGAIETIRGDVAVEADNLAKLLALLVVERGRIAAEAARIDNMLGGASVAADTFAEISALFAAEDTEDASTLNSVMTAIGERLQASQTALIALIDDPAGDKASIRAALDAMSASDVAAAIASLQSDVDTALNGLQQDIDGKQGLLSGLSGQRVGFDADGLLVAEDVPEVVSPGASAPTHLVSHALTDLFLPQRAMVRHQYRVVGDGAGNIAQTFAKHPFTGDRYSINAIDSLDHVIVRHGPDLGIDLKVVGRSDVSGDIPHQGFFFVPNASNPSDPWIIGSAGRGIPANENKISRFKYREAGTPITFETLDVFADGTGSGSTSPSMSPSGRYIVVRNAVDGTTQNEIKIYETQTLLDAFEASDQDQVNTHISSFILDSRFENNAQRDLPIQSLLVDDELVYVIMGYGDTRGPLAYAVCQHDGTLIAFDLDWQFAAEEAQSVERSAGDIANGVFPREVESARWAFFDGHWRPEISVGCGSSGNRTNMIFILGVGSERERNIDYWKETWTIRNSGVQQDWTVEMKRVGQTCTGFAYLNNLDVTGFSEGQNLEFEGLRYLPNNQWPVPILTSGINRSMDSVGALFTNGRFHIRELDRVDVDANGLPKDPDFSADIMDAVRVERSANYIRASLRYDVDF
jgi:hypothetical protein